MNVKILTNAPVQVRLYDLSPGCGFIDEEGDPYVVINPNTINFTITTISGKPMDVVVLSCGFGGVPILGHKSKNELVTPINVDMTFIERKKHEGS